jgi:RimJ/RimL family protein N-acetyltransferase
LATAGLLFRPLGPDELDLFNQYPAPTSGVGARSRGFDELVARGDYRPAWTWVALRGGEVVARAAFWAPPGSAHPFSLDWFDPGVGPDRVEVGAALLRVAYAGVVTPDHSAPPHPEGGRPDYLLFLPADWRERPHARADALDRITAAQGAGLDWTTERLTLRWTPADGLPSRSTRLRFVPADDDGLVTEVLARVFTDTLDTAVRADIERHGVRRAAELTLAEVADMPGGRGWWRLAYDTDGDLAGLVMPTRNPSSATIGYLGVVPGHRGHRYADDLIAEALHQFAEAGEAQVTDGTDVGNVPMAAAFARSGYQVTGRCVVLSWPVRPERAPGGAPAAPGRTRPATRRGRPTGR